MIGIVKNDKNEFIIQTTGNPAFNIEGDQFDDSLLECDIIAVKKSCNFKPGAVMSVKPEDILNITEGWWYTR